jgi:hypothetical protein
LTRLITLSTYVVQHKTLSGTTSASILGTASVTIWVTVITEILRIIQNLISSIRTNIHTFSFKQELWNQAPIANTLRTTSDTIITALLASEIISVGKEAIQTLIHTDSVLQELAFGTGGAVGRAVFTGEAVGVTGDAGSVRKILVKVASEASGGVRTA